MEITGKTWSFPIIGHPVDEVFSPPAYNRWFRENDVDCRMLALDLAPQAVARFLSLIRASPSFIGCSVTHPFKQAAFAQVDSLTARASRVGAVNTIRRDGGGKLSGDATDGRAMVEAIEALGGSICGNSALVLGAGGGAGRAIADALCESGVARLCLLDTDPGRLRTAERNVLGNWPDVPTSTTREEAAILINATTLGKAGDDSMPFASDQILGADMVCDVVTRRGRTRLVERALELDRMVISGPDMGMAQLGPQLGFLGLKPRRRTSGIDDG